MASIKYIVPEYSCAWWDEGYEYRWQGEDVDYYYFTHDGKQCAVEKEKAKIIFKEKKVYPKRSTLEKEIEKLKQVIKDMQEEVSNNSGMRNQYQDWEYFWKISNEALGDKDE